MGRDIVTFGAGELVVVGGDYGQIVLEGTSEEARRACDAVVAATRRSGDRIDFVGGVAIDDDQKDLFTARHAGPPLAEGSGPAGVDDETAAADGAGPRRAPSPE